MINVSLDSNTVTVLPHLHTDTDTHAHTHTHTYTHIQQLISQSVMQLVQIQAYYSHCTGDQCLLYRRVFTKAYQNLTGRGC